MAGQRGKAGSYRPGSGYRRTGTYARRRRGRKPTLLTLIVFLIICAYTYWDTQLHGGGNTETVQLAEVPPYDGEPYVVLNGNVPEFEEEDFTTQSFEHYAPLDLLGRCGQAFANIGWDLMPTGERESIWEVRPSGWKKSRYDFVDGESLYNRCHLIAHQLTAENANERNLITGTRYLNTEGMLPFEELVGDYIRDTGNHVLYRVTPVFEGRDLVAQGVQMEAQSVEDGGEDICFNVYCYNVQPGVEIDYATGANWEVN